MRRLLGVACATAVFVALLAPVAAVADEDHSHHAAAVCRPTAAQKARADKLVRDTRAGLAAYRDSFQATLQGYTAYLVPANWTYHYINYPRITDSEVLNPQRPEAILYAMTDNGYLPISALYMMPKVGMHGPAIGGCLTQWHKHDAVYAKEPWAAESREMLHVFIVPMRGGPFAYDADPRSVRELYTPFRTMVNPWWQDGCGGAPALPGNPYQHASFCETDPSLKPPPRGPVRFE
jgi:hypothetical protein